MPKKLIAGGVGIIGGLEKISKINSQGRFENIYFLSFAFPMETYAMTSQISLENLNLS